MKPTIVYQLETVHYRGEGIGNDWQFYIRTLAGIGRVESSIRPGETETTTRVIGIAEIENTDEVTDTWWVSVIEKDAGQDDRAPSSRYLVPMTIEPGDEYLRTISVEVADTGRRGRNDRAILDFQILARVLEKDETPPTLNATMVPLDPTPNIEFPTETAGSLPGRFEAIADGSNPRSVPVTGEMILQLSQGEAGTTSRQHVMARFLQAFSSRYHSTQFTPQIALYRIANPDGLSFWSSQNSSIGLRTQNRIIDALNDAIPAQGKQATRFERGRQTFIPQLLENTFAGDFGAAATALADLIMDLTEQNGRRVSVNRDLYTRTEEINWYAGIWHHAFFVEPTPFSGPDKDVWVVVWSDGWEE